MDWAGTENSTQLNDNVSWSHGRHLVKAGVSVPAFSRLGSGMRSNFGGTYYFSSLAAYTQGTAYSYVRRAGDGNVVFWQKQAAGFAQDEVRLRPNLSVAVGLRYEWQNYGAGSGNFAPRLSFAYALDKAAKTIVRGGAGLFYDVFPASDVRDTLLLNGTRLQHICCSTVSPWSAKCANPLPGAQPSQICAASIFTVRATPTRRRHRSTPRGRFLPSGRFIITKPQEA